MDTKNAKLGSKADLVSVPQIIQGTAALRSDGSSNRLLPAKPRISAIASGMLFNTGPKCRTAVITAGPLNQLLASEHRKLRFLKKQ